jgi:hypothetical protein
LFAGRAPVPKDADTAPRYFPTQRGAKWVFKSHGGKDTFVVTEVATEKDRTRVVVASERDGQLSASQTVIVTDRGLFRAALGNEVLDPPMCIFRSPVKAGEKWTASASYLGLFVLKYQFQVLDSEEVEVPAGKFKAVPIRQEFTVENDPKLKPPARAKEEPTVMIEWYVPNVGVVKRVVKGKTGDLEFVLESFTPGKLERPE